MIHNQRLTVCVVGAGSIFQQYHLPAIMKVRHFEIASIVDRNEHRARTIGNSLRVPWYTDLVDAPRADLSLITTPSQVRAEVIMCALDRKMHVLCEKPLSYDYIEASRFVQRAKDQDRSLLVAQTRRFFPNIRMLRSLLRRGILKFPLSITVVEGASYGWNAIADDRAKSLPSDHGVVHDNGAHVFDLLALFILDLGLDPEMFFIETSLRDRELSANNFMAVLRHKDTNKPIHVSVKLSREHNLEKAIIIQDSSVRLQTRSLFDTSLMIRPKNELPMQIFPQDPFPRNLEECFQEQWRSVLTHLTSVCPSAHKENIAALTVLPAINLIDRSIAASKIVPFDPYFAEGPSSWV